MPSRVALCTALPHHSAVTYCPVPLTCGAAVRHCPVALPCGTALDSAVTDGPGALTCDTALQQCCQALTFNTAVTHGPRGTDLWHYPMTVLPGIALASLWRSWRAAARHRPKAAALLQLSQAFGGPRFIASSSLAKARQARARSAHAQPRQTSQSIPSYENRAVCYKCPEPKLRGLVPTSGLYTCHADNRACRALRASFTSHGVVSHKS